MDKIELAERFSLGKFEGLENFVSEDVKWNIFEDDEYMSGKSEIVTFMNKIEDYFKSIETEFISKGVVKGDSNIAVYGYGTFKRDGKIVNTVNSCDIYEFNDKGLIQVINSYCNSKRPNK